MTVALSANLLLWSVHWHIFKQVQTLIRNLPQGKRLRKTCRGFVHVSWPGVGPGRLCQLPASLCQPDCEGPGSVHQATPKYVQPQIRPRPCPCGSWKDVD